MSDLRAEALSPIDAATLWPQMRRLSTEVVATRSGENLLVSSGLAATGLANLPRMPRTAVVGVKRGLTYRGVLAARELAGGASWEAVSLRIARDKDDEAVTALISGCGQEVAARGGRGLLMRYPEASPHGQAVRRGGVLPYRIERLHALSRAGHGGKAGRLRALQRGDRLGVFRLYCRTVPEHIRRQEAPTQAEWRAVLDSFDCEREFVLEGDRGLIAWAGFGERECRLLVDEGTGGAADHALDLVEAQGPRFGTLVVADDQVMLGRLAKERGYTPLGVRLVGARRLAVLEPLQEVVAVPAESLAIPR